MMSHDETMKRALDDQMSRIKQLVNDELLVYQLMGRPVHEEYIYLLEQLRVTFKREQHKGTPVAQAAKMIIDRAREFEMLITGRDTPILYSQFN